VPTTTITQEQRAGLYELVRNDLGGIGDISLALEQDDVDAAERFGHRFAEDLRLLADIGWHPGEEREAFELTMPSRELMRLLDRLHEDAERLLSGSPSERRSREEDEASDALILRGLDACEEVLVVLDQRGGDAS
jgi:hypothetical protein